MRIRKSRLTNKTIKGISSSHSRKRWRERAYAKDKKKKCPACKRSYNKAERRVTVDHIIPLSKGGKDDKSNWQLMCQLCNKIKGNTI